MRSVGAGRSVVVLLSGGLDSATVLALARASGAAAHTLSFGYGQRHAHELRAASEQAVTQGAASHRVVKLDTSLFRSALTDTGAAVPKGREVSAMSAGIPSTYVPARNTVFLAHALAYAESLRAGEIHIGANAVDYSGYPDCRPAFFAAFQRVADLGTRAGVEAGAGGAPQIVAPLLHWPKARIVREGLALGVDFAKTHSCYDPAPDGRPCSACDACILRADAFAALGFPVDPAVQRFADADAAAAAARRN